MRRGVTEVSRLRPNLIQYLRQPESGLGELLVNHRICRARILAIQMNMQRVDFLGLGGAIRLSADGLFGDRGTKTAVGCADARRMRFPSPTLRVAAAPGVSRGSEPAGQLAGQLHCRFMRRLQS